MRPPDPLAASDTRVARLLTRKDWSQTPLGQPDTWSQSLRVSLSICLESPALLSIVWGHELVFMYNDAWSVHFGEAHPHAFGRTAGEAFFGDADLVVTTCQQVMATGESARLRYHPFCRPTESAPPWYYFDHSFSPIFDGGGEVGGVMMVSHQSLEPGDVILEAGYRAMLNAAAAGIAETDRTGVFTYVNDRYCELVGRSRQDLIGRRTFLELTHPADVSENASLVEELVVTGRPFNVEKRYRRPDGTVVWVNNYISWVGPPNDPQSRWVAACIDVTARHQAELELRRSEERKSFLLQLGDRLRTLSDPLAVQDAAAEMLGRHLRADRVTYGMLTPDGQVVSGRGYTRGVPPLPERFHLRKAAPQVLECFLQDCTSVCVDAYLDESVSEAQRKAWESAHIQAHVSVPLSKNGRLVAALGVHQARARQWGESEIMLIEETAERTWAAVEQASAEAALAQELVDNRRLQELSTRLIPADNTRMLFDELVKAAVEIMAGDRGTIQLYDPDQHHLMLLSTHCIGEKIARASEIVDAGSDTSYALAMELGERVIVVDYETDPRFAGTEGAAMHLQAGVRAVQSTPLIARSGQMVGMISTHWHEARQPTDRQLRLLDILARQAADLVERHRSEAALRESEERYRSLFNSMDEGFCVVETLFDEAGRPYDFRFVDANPAFDKHSGLTKVVGRRIRELVPNLEDYWLELYGDVVMTGQPKRFVRTAEHLGGRSFDVYAFPFGERDQHRVALVFSNITQRVRTEEELKAADRRKNEFLAMLAHELRNPLAPIRTGLEVLRLSQGQQETAEHTLELMERQMRHMVRLVEDLLDISRITQGKLQVKRERCDLRTILDNAIESSRPLVGSSGVELSVDVPPDAVRLNADAARLAQVFSNLLNNAAKYTEAGGHIWFTAQTRGTQLWVSVRDTGTGIPPAMLGRVFDAFAQVEQSRDRSQGGLGVGLSLVKTLVELHGGVVEARSDGPGKGSEFIVRLPDLVLSEPEQRTPEPAADGEQQSFRIQVVDDNVDAATALATMLEILGHQVRTAHGGREGVELAENFRPDLLLLDLGMPEVDGYEAVHRIRRQPWGEDMVIAALTGWGQEEDRRRTRDAGFDHHLVKPVEHSALQQLLENLPEQLADPIASS